MKIITRPFGFIADLYKLTKIAMTPRCFSNMKNLHDSYTKADLQTRKQSIQRIITARNIREIKKRILTNNISH